MMWTSQIDGGWRVQVSPTIAIEFDNVRDAEDFTNRLDSGEITLEALAAVLLRRARTAKHER